MTYGSPQWDSWVLPEEEGLEHIKAAYDAGINTFDTANASRPLSVYAMLRGPYL